MAYYRSNGRMNNLQQIRTYKLTDLPRIESRRGRTRQRLPGTWDYPQSDKWTYVTINPRAIVQAHQIQSLSLHSISGCAGRPSTLKWVKKRTAPSCAIRQSAQILDNQISASHELTEKAQAWPAGQPGRPSVKGTDQQRTKQILFFAIFLLRGVSKLDEDERFFSPCTLACTEGYNAI